MSAALDVERANISPSLSGRLRASPHSPVFESDEVHRENITVYIDDNQLIVGRAGSQGRYGILYPELDGDFLDPAIEAIAIPG
jgi:formate C-acetyltransferase